MTSTFECSKKWGDYRWNRDLVKESANKYPTNKK